MVLRATSHTIIWRKSFLSSENQVQKSEARSESGVVS